MAHYAQVARGNQPHDDITVYNNSAVEIPANLIVLYETVSGYPNAVKLPTNGGGLLRMAGVTVTAIAANGYGTMCRRGPAVVKAHNAIATGEFVQGYDVTDHLGEAVVLDKGSTIEAAPCLGQCLVASGADSELCLVDVNITPVTTTA